MNCRDAERLIFAERDGALADNQRAGLDAHLAGCANCRRTRTLLAEAADAWRARGTQVDVPDPGVEWQAIRQAMRNVQATGANRGRRRPAAIWLGVPLGAAAALALMFAAGFAWFGGRGASAPDGKMPRVEFVELTGHDESAVVYVDQESGWLVVWAVAGKPVGGT